jgi:hypothetical protein
MDLQYEACAGVRKVFWAFLTRLLAGSAEGQSPPGVWPAWNQQVITNPAPSRTATAASEPVRLYQNPPNPVPGPKLRAAL